ncbi:hypothetical protein L3081_13780 [Colwellia sp. MSW7]|uniref:DUF2147 domain-containing protein n=1 Tax=Colwellia maritima TaxID=2912588 RepID=A0ABS9X258_9GAMM|nr:hypothetical protein [Colwellia maritima]MCI2284259.1 hypothetical protein [Colwellia maritima]
MKLFALIISLSFFSQFSLVGTYEVILEGKKCQEDDYQQLNCSYKVGKDLHIEIAGIGQEDTGIAFLKSNFNGDYYGKFGLLHGCVIVNNGNSFSDFAFISPKNGKVYKSWENCKNQK